MTSLSELADAVEGLSEPSREMDARIVTTLCPGATVSEYVKGEGDDIVFHAEALGIRNKDCCPWFTHSLDAALTLVPEGQEWAYLDKRAIIRLPGSMAHEFGEAATPALALCAAALRARASGEGA